MVILVARSSTSLAPEALITSMHFAHVSSLIAVAFLTACTASTESESESDAALDHDTEAVIGEQKDALYIASLQVWPTNHIAVCWENPSSSDANLREAVKQKIANTWSAVSRVRFTNWQACPSGWFSGIRIRIADTAADGAHTKGLGVLLNGKPDGMVLNFTFKNWNTGCQSKVQSCVEGIAVHEFGHALGFAHEHNRADTPDSCTAAEQGSYGDTNWGAWDLSSVMNYCNPASSSGILSSTDRSGVQSAYSRNGAPGVLRTMTGHYVVAEGAGGGVVNANRTGTGPWENFNMVELSPGLVAIQAINGQYVSAEGGGGGAVNANRTAIGDWEKFRVVPLGPSKMAFKTHNGKYLRAAGGGGGALRADGAGPGPYETFAFMGL